MRSAIVAREDGEQIVGEAACVSIDAIEFGFLPEAVCRSERPGRRLQVECLMSTRRDDSRLTPSGACGPSRDGGQSLPCLNEWPCAHGSREYVDDEPCSVGKCASCLRTRRESCAKTSTWWAEKKAGKGTQRTVGCQARTAHETSRRCGFDLWITRSTSV